ncbi:MAG: hypothetical protein E6J42_10230 [Chloroflexi bacterium]|nr:MAG: hypothetical protein E6J42_10230 [Chloroflexota bacterium]
MSRGLGRLQRRIFEILPPYAEAGISTTTIMGRLGRKRQNVYKALVRMQRRDKVIRSNDVQPPWNSFWRLNLYVSRTWTENRKRIRRYHAGNVVAASTPAPVQSGIARLRRW